MGHDRGHRAAARGHAGRGRAACDPRERTGGCAGDRVVRARAGGHRGVLPRRLGRRRARAGGGSRAAAGRADRARRAARGVPHARAGPGRGGCGGGRAAARAGRRRGLRRHAARGGGRSVRGPHARAGRGARRPRGVRRGRRDHRHRRRQRVLRPRRGAPAVQRAVTAGPGRAAFRLLRHARRRHLRGVVAAGGPASRARAVGARAVLPGAGTGDRGLRQARRPVRPRAAGRAAAGGRGGRGAERPARLPPRPRRRAGGRRHDRLRHLTPVHGVRQVAADRRGRRRRHRHRRCADAQFVDDATRLRAARRQPRGPCRASRPESGWGSGAGEPPRP